MYFTCLFVCEEVRLHKNYGTLSRGGGRETGPGHFPTDASEVTNKFPLVQHVYFINADRQTGIGSDKHGGNNQRRKPGGESVSNSKLRPHGVRLLRLFSFAQLAARQVSSEFEEVQTETP